MKDRGTVDQIIETKISLIPPGTRTQIEANRGGECMS